MEDEQSAKDGILKTAARALGTAAAKIALLGKGGEPSARKDSGTSANSGRIAPSKKSRLPRRVKKAQKKAAASGRK